MRQLENLNTNKTLKHFYDLYLQNFIEDVSADKKRLESEMGQCELTRDAAFEGRPTDLVT